MVELIEHVETSGSVADLPRVWIKGFWGFGPEDDGYVGFTQEAARENFITKAARGDLVVIYGAVSANTDPKQQRQVLGILEVDPVAIRDTDAMSEQGRQRKVGLGTEKRWTFAVPCSGRGMFARR